MKNNHKTTARFIVFTLLFLMSVNTSAQYTKEQLKTAYIFNFAENIKWNNESDMAAFTISVLGNNESILKELKTFSEGEKIKNKPIRIKSSNSIEDILSSQIIYIPKEQNKNIKTLYRAAWESDLLLVTDNLDDKQFVMINFIYKDDDRIHFELNEKTIADHNLSVLPDMVLLGGTNLDVQELYKKSQSNLLTKQEQLEEQQKLSNKLQSDLKRIAAEIERQRDLISSQTARLFEQQKQLDAKNDELKQLLADTEQKSKLLEEQKKIQEEQQAEIDKKRKELEEYTTQLQEKYKEVESLQIEIDEKQSILNRQNITIATQQNLMYVMILIILLVLSLIFVIYRGFRNKKIANKKLEEKNQHIEEQRQELAKSYAQLKELEDFKESMTNMIVHDLKNPLNSIIGLSEAEANKEGLKTINGAGRRMLHLVTNILDINKFEESKFQLKLESHRILGVIDEAIDEVKVELKSNSIKVVNYTDSSLVGNYDFEIIARVLMNILTNAIKYTSPGGTIRIESVQENNKIKIAVADTGQGIPADKIDSIFDKFSQVKNKMYGKTSSTGLGLSFCKLAVEAHEGKIWVESEVGKGTTFFITVLVGNEGDAEPVQQVVEPDVSTGQEDTASFSFTEEEITAINSILPELNNCKIFEYGKISDIIGSLGDDTTGELKQWQEEVLESAIMSNEVRYRELISENIVKR